MQRETPLKEIVNEIRSIEPFPSVVMRILDLASGEDVVPDDLIEVIQTDAGVMAKVLKLCNSAYYGFQRRISSLPEAGNLLGVSTLVNLVLTCTASDSFSRADGPGEDAREDLWQTCLVHAVASRLLAQKHQKTDPERAYTAGLLQNIGGVVLERFYEDARVFVDALVKEGKSRIEAEN